MGDCPPSHLKMLPLMIILQRGLISGLHAQSVSCGFAAANVRINRITWCAWSSSRFHSGSDTASRTLLVNFSGGSLLLSVCNCLSTALYIPLTKGDRMPPGHHPTPRDPVFTLFASVAPRKGKRAGGLERT